MSPRRKLSEARRLQILESAAHVMMERGLNDTRIADIAERAGTSPALVLYYFPTKDQLLADALTFAEERFYTDTADELSRIPRARDRLIRLIELSCSTEGSTSEEWMDEYILWLDLWARSPRDPEVAKNREILDRRWRTSIVDIVRDGQAAGEFKPVDAEDFALLLASLVDGLAIQVVLGDPDVSVERMRKMCLRVTASELGFDLPTRRRAKAGPGSKRAAAR